MKKNPFQVFLEINEADEVNKTSNLAVSFTMVEANSDPRGGLITMGVERKFFNQIASDERIVMLVTIDKAEFNKRMNS